MSCAAQGGWEINKLDVVTAFLNPAIDKDIYMQLLEGMEWLITEPLPAGSTHKSTHKSTHNLRAESRLAVSSAESVSTPDSNSESVSTPDSISQSGRTPDRNSKTAELSIFMNGSLKLNKALYGLKQAPLLWHATINKFLLSIGRIRAHADENLYLRFGVFLLLYVDDTQIFYPPSASEAAEDLKAALKKEYKMTNLRKAKQFLGLEIERHDSGVISLGQSKYIRTILKHVLMDHANPVTTPLHDKIRLEVEPKGEAEVAARHYQSIVGSLLYAASATQPDLAFAFSALSRYSKKPYTSHLSAAKRVLQYLQHTADLKLVFPCTSTTSKPLVGFTDSDFAKDIDGRKSQ